MWQQSQTDDNCTPKSYIGTTEWETRHWDNLHSWIQATETQPDLPIVGMVVTISPSLSLYRIVVFPAASSPTLRKMEQQRIETTWQLGHASSLTHQYSHVLFPEQFIEQTWDSQPHYRVVRQKDTQNLFWETMQNQKLIALGRKTTPKTAFNPKEPARQRLWTSRREWGNCTRVQIHHGQCHVKGQWNWRHTQWAGIAAATLGVGRAWGRGYVGNRYAWITMGAV